MKRFAALAVVVLGALASVTAAQAGNTTITNTSTPISFSAPVPCANGGVGEVVDFTGTIHELIRTTVNDNHVSSTLEENFQGLKGTGETTGDTYVGNGHVTESLSGSLTNGQLTETAVLHEAFNGQGSAPNLTISELFHITVNANGDVTTSFSDFEVTCG
jgi:hypothetical protein